MLGVFTAAALAFLSLTGSAQQEMVVSPVCPSGASLQPVEPLSVLVFSKTAGFRHGSIPDGVAALRAMGEAEGFRVDATEDAARFNDDDLAGFDVIVFLSTTGDVLDDEQEAAFERFIKAGGGYAGIHAAADTEYDWPWYGRLVGGYFKSHPRIQPADVVVEDRDHPSTRHLDERWRRTDEWYNYRENPRERSSMRVLMRLDTGSYEGSAMAEDHPIAWCHEFEGGRAWYTGGGHTSESFREPEFLRHMLGGIMWAAGRELEPDVPETTESDGAKLE